MGQCRAESINRFPEFHVYVRIDNPCICQYIQGIAGWKRGFLSLTPDSSPQGYGLEVIEKPLKTPSARVGFAPVDKMGFGRELRGQRAAT
jgi:hypothetical protein